MCNQFHFERSPLFKARAGAPPAVSANGWEDLCIANGWFLLLSQIFIVLNFSILDAFSPRGSQNPQKGLLALDCLLDVRTSIICLESAVDEIEELLLGHAPRPW